MKEPLDPRIREIGWRQQLTDAEQAEIKRHLAANPEGGEAWETELELTRLLDKLPEAPPVSSNFTSLVLQAIQADARATERARKSTLWNWHSWIPRIAVACVALSIGLLALRQHEARSREVLAQRVATVAQAVPDAELVKDFSMIARLADQPPKADTDLLALMQ